MSKKSGNNLNTNIVQIGAIPATSETMTEASKDGAGSNDRVVITSLWVVGFTMLGLFCCLIVIALAVIMNPNRASGQIETPGGYKVHGTMEKSASPGPKLPAATAPKAKK